MVLRAAVVGEVLHAVVEEILVPGMGKAFPIRRKSDQRGKARVAAHRMKLEGVFLLGKRRIEREHAMALVNAQTRNTIDRFSGYDNLKRVQKCLSRPVVGGRTEVIMAYKRMKPARQAGSSPVSQQFSAEMRQAVDLKNGGRLQEAQDHLEQLHRRYPTRTEPLRLLLDVTQQSGDRVTYDEVIARLLQITPDDPDIMLAQAGNTLSQGQVALALERFQRFLTRWPKHEEAQEARRLLVVLKEELAKTMDAAGLHQANRFELAARNDEIQVCLMQGRYAEAQSLAKQLLSRVEHYAPALNNLTLTYMVEGQVDQAISYAQRVLEFDPDNVHALGNLARCCQMLGRKEESTRYAERMKSSEAFAADKIDKIVETLSFIGDDAGVLAVYQHAREEQNANRDEKQEAQKRGQEGDLDLESPMLHHLAGAAAMRLGEESAARSYWKQALKLKPDFALAKENLADLRLPVGERNAPWAFSFTHWLDQVTLHKFVTLMEACDLSDPEKTVVQALHTLLQSHPQLEPLVPTLLERGDPAGRQFMFFVAKAAKTPIMMTALRDFALSRNGTDQMRLEAANVAVQAGVLAPGLVRLWVRGEWQEVMLIGWELYSEVESSPHSPEVEQLAERAMEALYKSNGNRGEQLLMQALEIEPEAPDLLNNLANAYRLQGRREEADELMVQIHERFPDYFFGKINMVHLDLAAGRLKEAEEMLAPLILEKRLHFSEFAALAQANIEVALAKGEQERARQWYEMWKQALPDHPLLFRYRLQLDGPDLLKPGVLKNLFKRR
jgi:tetratricopeptide (TPR) repeat protein